MICQLDCTLVRQVFHQNLCCITCSSIGNGPYRRIHFFYAGKLEYPTGVCSLSDNASNMVKAMQEASLAHFGCFAHSLQLVIKDRLLSQRAIPDIISICKSVVQVGHFHRSSTASHSLTRIQESLNIPCHKLKQDISTRWNSTLYMFQSILEQKMALAAYCAENDNIQQLPTHQLVLVRKCVNIISPIEEIIRSISARLACVSRGVASLQLMGGHGQYIDPAQTFLLTKQKANDPMMG